MSQQKVDKYKEYKKNRKQIIAKEKRKKTLARVTAWVILVLAVCTVAGLIIVSAYNSYQAKQAAKPNYEATSFELVDFAGITETQAAEQTSEESAEEPSSETAPQETTPAVNSSQADK